MEINIHDKNKTLEIWLTNAEKNDASLQAQLKPLYAAYGAQKYTVVVYLSGQTELYPTLRELLIYNKNRTVSLGRFPASCHFD